METKICTKCGKELSLDQFNWRDKSKGTRRSECKTCHNNYMKQKYKEKQVVVQELKAQCSCAKCGDKRGYVLDYHHINPNEKEEGVARMVSNNYTLNKVYNEIEKCVVLCANCHREYHYFQSQNKIKDLLEYLALGN